MRALPLLIAALLLLAGCGTEKGSVGDTLQARTISARLIDVDTRPGLVAVDVGLCNKHDAAVIAYHFQLVLSDGTKLHPSWRSSHSPGFETTRSECTRGWIEFGVPRNADVKELDYRYDGTDGSSQYNGGDNSEHDHFVWSL